jgi:hypothetical protein
MATFGNTATYALWGYSLAPDEAGAIQFTLSEAAIVSKISAYMRNTTSTSVHKAGIYSDSGANVPLTRQGAATPEVSVTTAGGEAWWDFVYASPVTLSPGTYWLALISGANSAAAEISYAATGSLVNWYVGSYATGPPATWVDGGGGARLWSIYATYTVPSFTGLTVTKLLNG